MSAAVSGLYLAQGLCQQILHVPRLGFVPFVSTNAALFLLVTAFRGYRIRLHELSRATIEAQYAALKNQLRPHFLFNSLNSLSELIERDPQAAVEMTQKLSDLYRQLLKNSTLRTATLSSELEIIEKYLEIERLRFEDRVRYRVAAPPEADQIFVPSLMLQTLVENAVKHGIAPAVEGGAIDLTVLGDRREGYKRTLKNTGIPYEGTKSGGTGLRNTRERLKLLYGAASRFSIARTGPRETVVSFHVSGASLND
jgi:LytS/YehU family sensor histidine kinase